jgi:serine phosphatase RsbU (regulator of sigma subunit)
MGLLPDPSASFAGETRFAIAALLEPARAVGGDYYDCFMLDESRLCFAIGDVSGKGIPASLFMAISKTLTGTLARRHPDLGEAVQAVEQELSRENSEFLFVTAFVAILDVDRGILDYVCAGHDAPILLRHGEVSRLDTSNGGPPLCALGDFPYVSERIQLQAGDLLCLFTDGVTEATDGKTLFGGDRLLATLRELAEATPATAVNDLRDAVRRFEAGEAPADDLTLLALRWQGKA